MLTVILYMAISLIWGSTWLAIQHQVHHAVPVIWSVVYRFGMASTLMLLYCILTRANLRFTRREHKFMFLQGILFASLDYYFSYLSSQYLLSGVVSLVFASIAIINIFTSRLILKHMITRKVMSGALVGIIGLCMVILSEIGHIQNAHPLNLNFSMVIGISLCLIAVLFCSLGTITASYNRTHNKLPILQTTAISLGYGTCCSILIAVLTHQTPRLDLSADYLGALFYLSVAGTVIAFAIYTTLLERVGPARVGYIFVVTPVVSLVLSTIFEGFHWTIITILGVIFVLVGNMIVMYNRKVQQQIRRF